MINEHDKRSAKFGLKPHANSKATLLFGGELGRKRRSAEISRETIEAETAAFLAKGGSITRLDDLEPLVPDVEDNIENFDAVEHNLDTYRLIDKHNSYNIF